MTVYEEIKHETGSDFEPIYRWSKREHSVLHFMSLVFAVLVDVDARI